MKYKSLFLGGLLSLAMVMTPLSTNAFFEITGFLIETVLNEKTVLMSNNAESQEYVLVTDSCTFTEENEDGALDIYGDPPEVGDTVEFGGGSCEVVQLIESTNNSFTLVELTAVSGNTVTFNTGSAVESGDVSGCSHTFTSGDSVVWDSTDTTISEGDRLVGINSSSADTCDIEPASEEEEVEEEEEEEEEQEQEQEEEQGGEEEGEQEEESEEESEEEESEEENEQEDEDDHSEDTINKIVRGEDNTVVVHFDDGSTETYQLFPSGTEKAKAHVHSNGQHIVAVTKKKIRVVDGQTGETVQTKSFVKKSQYNSKLKQFNVYKNNTANNAFVLTQPKKKNKKKFKLVAYTVSNTGTLKKRTATTIELNKNAKFSKLTVKKNKKSGKKARILVKKGKKTVATYRVTKKGKLIEVE